MLNDWINAMIAGDLESFFELSSKILLWAMFILIVLLIIKYTIRLCVKLLMSVDKDVKKINPNYKGVFDDNEDSRNNTSKGEW